ncbi:MAG: DUF885 family protein, partial [Candidatus Glassbacteria bacterium]|nr:DUF885 family protein [Candidatus Glassbacteria bacterium]
MTSGNDSLVKEIQEFIWRENPVEATMVGIHRYDDRLEKLDLVSRKNKLRQKKEYLEQIKSLESSGALDPELLIISGALEVGIRMEEELQSLDRDAGTYPRLAVYGLYQLIARSSEPFHYRALRAIDRMREIPRLLSEGKLNLTYGDNIPLLWTQAAVEMTAAGRECLEHLTGLLKKEVPELGQVLEKYTGEVLAAFDEYLDFLLNEVEPRSNGNFSIGPELFDFLLRREHKLEASHQALSGTARREADRISGKLEKAASRMEGPDDWRRQLERIQGEVPVEDLPGFWKGTIDRVRRSVEQAGLVSLPGADELKIMETPLFERAAIPQAGYIPAPPLEKDSRAFFCITPGDAGRAGERSGLEAAAPLYSRQRALLTVIRELYPGRHTLLSVRKNEGSPAALLSRGGVLEDGWCSYACELVAEKKVLDDPDLRLLMLHQQLVDACLVLADIRL